MTTENPKGRPKVDFEELSRRESEITGPWIQRLVTLTHEERLAKAEQTVRAFLRDAISQVMALSSELSTEATIIRHSALIASLVDSITTIYIENNRR